MYSGDRQWRCARALAAICIDPPHGTPPIAHAVVIRRALCTSCAPQRSVSCRTRMNLPAHWPAQHPVDDAPTLARTS
eukprot:3208443-Prymnesium_polylepis.1